MSFPTRQNPFRLVRTKRLHLSDKGRVSCRLILEGAKLHSVRQIHPESIAGAGQKSCDWVVEILSELSDEAQIIEQIFVELKSKNGLEKAVEQIAQTIERFDPQLNRHAKRSYAVGMFTKPAQQRVRLEDKRFQKKYRSRFELARGRTPVPLCSA